MTTGIYKSLSYLLSIFTAFLMLVTPYASVNAQTVIDLGTNTTTDISATSTAPLEGASFISTEGGSDPVSLEEGRGLSIEDGRAVEPGDILPGEDKDPVDIDPKHGDENGEEPVGSPESTTTTNPDDMVNNKVDTSRLTIEADQSTGALVYSYLFRLPAGRNGLSPELSLTYSSEEKSNTSLVGYGWKLSIPYIKRKNVLGIDKMYGREDFETSLHGNLEKVSTGVFKAKVDDGSFVTYTQSAGQWIMTTKSGVTYTFGSTNASKKYDPNTTTDIYQWYLTSIEDTNGNKVIYTYTKDQEQVYPTTITYTDSGSTTGSYKVIIGKVTRPDNLTNYESGYKVQTDYIINTVQVEVNGTLRAKYLMDHEPGDNMLRSLLSSVTETVYDVNGVSNTDETEFEYSEFVNDSFDFNMQWDLQPTGNWTHDKHKGDATFSDLNGDGYTDQFWSKNSSFLTSPEEWVHLNSTDNYWFANSNSTYLPGSHSVIELNHNFCNGLTGPIFGSTNAVDLNGDQFTDFLETQDVSDQWCSGNYNFVRPSTSTSYISQNGNGFAQDTNYSPTITLDVRDSRYFKNRLRDFNGDGLPDILKASVNPVPVSTTPDNGYIQAEIEINNGSGFDTLNTTDWVWPVRCSGNCNIYTYFSPESKTYRINDFNGDSIGDFFYGLQFSPLNQKIAFLGNGRGDWDSQEMGSAITYNSSNMFNDGAFADVNADGLIDYVSNTDGYQGQNYFRKVYKVFLNNGEDFTYSPGHSIGFSQISLFSGGSAWLPIDFNADGKVDFVSPAKTNPSNGATPPSGGTYKEVDVVMNIGNKPDMLTSISHPTGSTTSVEYKPSTHYRDGNGDILSPKLPLIIQTAHKITTDDHNGIISTTEYEYADGHYFYNGAEDRRFAGFGKVTTVNSKGETTETYFHQGNGNQGDESGDATDGSKIGKVYKTVTKDNGGAIVASTYTTWNNHDLGNDRDFVFVSESVEDIDGKQTAILNTYNTSTGNLTSTQSLGEVNITNTATGAYSNTGQDNKTTTYTYTTGVLQLPSSETLFDHFGVTVGKSEYYYDGSNVLGSATTGNLTKQRAQIDSLTWSEVTRTNDSYGNVLTETDPEGNITTYVYDSYNLYPVTVTNDLGHVTTYTYDYATGQPLTVQDPNLQTSTMTYDGYGRPLSVTTPLGLTTSYQYQDGSVPNWVKQTNHLDNSTAVDSYTYYDGLYRPIQTKVETENSNEWITSDTIYNDLGQIEKVSLPYFTSSSSYSAPTTNQNLLTTTVYDALGRPTAVTDATGTTSYTYNRFTTAITDKNSVQKDLKTDAYGNLIQVTERESGTPYYTSYSYTARNELSGLTDAEGNIRSFSYDMSGRRTSVTDLRDATDPDYGTHTYTYDLARNMLTHTKPDASVITYTYDDLNRPATETDGVTTTSYYYDNCANGKGRLCFSSDTNITTLFTYDTVGNVLGEGKIVAPATVPMTTNYTYDRQGNVLSVYTPDNTSVTYTYNSGGQIETIYQGTTPIVLDFDYGPTGAVIYKAYPNNIASYYSYDPNELYRLKNITTIDPPLLEEYGVELEKTEEVAKEETTETVTEETLPVKEVDSAETRDENRDVDAMSEEELPSEDVLEEAAKETSDVTEVVTEEATPEVAKDVVTDESTEEAPETTEPTEAVLEETTPQPKEEITPTTTAEEPAPVHMFSWDVLQKSKETLPAVEKLQAPEGKRLVGYSANSLTYENPTEEIIEEGPEGEGDIYVSKQEMLHTTQFYSSPVFYQDGDEWKQIDTRLKSTHDGSHFVIDTAQYQLVAPQSITDRLFSLTVDGLEVAWNLSESSKDPITLTRDREDSRIAVAQDAFGSGIDLRLSAYNDSVVKDIVINDQKSLGAPVDGNYTINIALQTNADEVRSLGDLGGYELIQNGEVKSQITTAVVRDNTGKTQEITLGVEKVGDEYLVTKYLPQEWVDQAEFPVVTDAVTSFTSTGSWTSSNYVPVGGQQVIPTQGLWDTLHDAVHSYGWGTYPYLSAYSSIGNPGTNIEGYIGRGHLVFDTSSLPVSLQIQSADIKLGVHQAYQDYQDQYEYLVVTESTQYYTNQILSSDYSRTGATNNPIELSAHSSYVGKVNNDWIVLPLNTVGKNTIDPSGYSKFAIREGHDTEDIYKQPVNGVGYRGGIQFKSHWSQNNGRWPTLEVTYNPNATASASVTTEGQTNPTNITDSTPEFSGTFSDPDPVDTAVSFEIEVTTGNNWTTPLWSSGVQTLAAPLSNGSTMPDFSYAGVPLALDGKTYDVRLRFTDQWGTTGAWDNGTFTMANISASNGSLHIDCLDAQSGTINPIDIKCSPMFSTVNGGSTTSDTIAIQVNDDINLTGTMLWNSTPITIGDTAPGDRTSNTLYQGNQLDFNGTTYYVRTRFYDAAGNPGAWSQPGQFTTYSSIVFQDLQYRYDALGNIIYKRDGSDTALAQETYYTYDHLNRLTGVETWPDTGAPSLVYYTYSPTGNILSVNQNGVTTNYTYNEPGKTNPQAVTTIGSDTYDYDDNGQLIARNNDTFTYDTWGRMISSAVSGSGGGSTTTQTVLALSESFENMSGGGTLGSWSNVTGDSCDWRVDSNGTPSSSTGPASGNGDTYYAYVETSSGYCYTSGNTSNLEYDLSGPTDGSIEFTYHMYGSNMGTLRVQAFNGSSWSTIWTLSGNQGNSWSQTQTATFPQGTTKLRFHYIAAGSYRGDAAIDLVDVYEGSTLTYSEDFEPANQGNTWANVLGDTCDWIVDGFGTPSSSTGPSSAYDGLYYAYVETSSGHCYYSGNTADYEYVLSTPTSGLVDFHYHMYGSNMGTLNVQAFDGSAWTSLWTKSGNQGTAWSTKQSVQFPVGTEKLRFHYTAAGSFRGDVAIDLVDVYEDTVITTGGGSGTVNYSYDATGGRVVKDDGTDVTTYTNRYYHEKNDGVTTESTVNIYAGSDHIATLVDGTLTWNHTDHLGSASVSTNSATQITEEIDYLPFGGERLRNSISSTADKTFTDHYNDTETGLLYMQARYYDPGVRRFMAQDPASFNNPLQFANDPQQLNLYTYVRNNPIIGVDPSGKAFALAAVLAPTATAAVTKTLAVAATALLAIPLINEALGDVEFTMPSFESVAEPAMGRQQQAVLEALENYQPEELKAEIGHPSTRFEHMLYPSPQDPNELKPPRNNGPRWIGVGAIGATVLAGLEHVYGRIKEQEEFVQRFKQIVNIGNGDKEEYIEQNNAGMQFLMPNPNPNTDQEYLLPNTLDQENSSE